MLRLASVVASTLLLAPASANVVAAGGDRTITQVVKLLQNLLKQSKADGDSDREMFAKYQCYCDKTKVEKEGEIVDTGFLVSQVEELQATNGKLSRQVAKLDADMKANEETRNEAEAIRTKENEAYKLLKEDLESALAQMKQAIEVLSEIGADQTLGSAADHKQYMAEGASLLKLRTSVKQALMAATAFVSKKQLKTVDAFLQAPFTGTYTSQSGEVVGILKDMRDTFEANLKEATATEAKQLAEYEKLMEEMLDAYNTMKDEYDGKQGKLGENDGIVGQKKMQLENLEKQIEAARAFLDKLAEMCTAKKEEYDHRVKLRMNEQSALSEAIAILNSDAAFETFGAVDATKTGATGPASFLQRAGVRAHRARRSPSAVKVTPAAADRRVSEFLQKVSGSESSPLFSRVLALLQANNPFATVLAEIEKMVQLLAKEGKADLEQKEWCVEERKVTNDGVKERQGDITGLEGALQELDEAINDPETGLKVSIKNDEESLQTNFKSQEEETKARREDNIKYQKDIKGLVSAQSLLERAVEVLKKYYEKKIHEIQAGLVQVHGKKQDPEPPSTWDDEKYEGQSEGGNSAIGMLEFILKNTKAEEKTAHTDEMTAQHSYEDSMQGLKDEEEELQDGLAKNRKELAQKEEEMLDKQKQLEKTKEELAALEAYLEKIKPGCDFIMENIDQRDQHRASEKKALETAVEKIKSTPAYKDAMAAAHTESLGKCADVCAEKTEEHVECKACLAKVTVPGYCAGHAGTMGC